MVIGGGACSGGGSGGGGSCGDSAVDAAPGGDSTPTESTGVQRSAVSSLGVRDGAGFTSDSTLSNIDVRLEALNKLVF